MWENVMGCENIINPRDILCDNEQFLYFCYNHSALAIILCHNQTDPLSSDRCDLELRYG